VPVACLRMPMDGDKTSADTDLHAIQADFAGYDSTPGHCGIRRDIRAEHRIVLAGLIDRKTTVLVRWARQGGSLGAPATGAGHLPVTSWREEQKLVMSS
jgi:hypothetical protein